MGNIKIMDNEKFNNIILDLNKKCLQSVDELNDKFNKKEINYNQYNCERKYIQGKFEVLNEIKLNYPDLIDITDDKILNARNLTPEENKQLMIKALEGVDKIITKHNKDSDSLIVRAFELEDMCKMSEGSSEVYVYVNDIPIGFAATKVDFDFDGSLKIFIKDPGLSYEEKTE